MTESPFQFERISRLPPYVLGQVTQWMMEARRRGEDIINLGMGNPDLPTPQFIVDKLCEAAQKPQNHRYSLSRGIPKLRKAVCDRYKRQFNVDLNPETEAVVTIGAKEGISHLVLACVGPGDVVFVPNPCYPIHLYAAVIAGAEVRSIKMEDEGDFFERMEKAIKTMWPKPKMLLLSFPSNPTTQVVDLSFFEKVVAFARENKILVVHDLAYADLVFDGYRAPSILQVPGAKEVAVEMYTVSKSFSMPGWRVGFCLGNKEVVYALSRLKSYFDYGVFQPIQIAATYALEHEGDCVKEICDVYRQRRDVLCDGLQRIGWEIEKPKATMFVWAKIPEAHFKEGSMAFAKRVLQEGKVMLSPGIGFGEYGEGYVRFALVENEERIRQAVRGIKKAL